MCIVFARFEAGYSMLHLFKHLLPRMDVSLHDSTGSAFHRLLIYVMILQYVAQIDSCVQKAHETLRARDRA